MTAQMAEPAVDLRIVISNPAAMADSREKIIADFVALKTPLRALPALDPS